MRAGLATWVVAVGVLMPLAVRADEWRPLIGARLGAQAWYFDRDAPAGLRGGVFQLDAGAAWTPSDAAGWRLAVYGFGQRAILDERGDRLPRGPAATSDALGLGVRLRTNPGGAVGLLVDLGLARRWLRVPYDDPTPPTRREASFSGWEPLRLGAGPTIALDRHWSMDVLVGFALGRFAPSTASASTTCAVSDACSDSAIDDGTPRLHLLLDLGLALHFEG